MCTKTQKKSSNPATGHPQEAVAQSSRNEVTPLTLLILAVRTVVYVGMIVTMVAAKWVWDIPGMKQINTRHYTNACMMYLLQHWYPCAWGVTFLLLFVLVMLIVQTHYKPEQARKLNWIHSLLALLAFLVPVTLGIAFVLGLIGDLLLKLSSIG